jgi:hypothetical protein
MPKYPGHELKQGDVDPAVSVLKERLNRYRDANPTDDDKQPILRVKDQLFSGNVQTRVRQFQKSHGLNVDGVVGPQTWTALFPESAPLRMKAFNVATGFIGAFEIGGNNMGPFVTTVIKANGGSIPEPWCGDFAAYCYRLAGSKSVDVKPRSLWAYVPFLHRIPGTTIVKNPQIGDLVRFDWNGDGLADHVGLFEEFTANGQVQTVDGNTGKDANVSDSTVGGDGVHRRIRSVALVHDYVRINR